jgi:hypothetical protein
MWHIWYVLKFCGNSFFFFSLWLFVFFWFLTDTNEDQDGGTHQPPPTGAVYLFVSLKETDKTLPLHQWPSADFQTGGTGPEIPFLPGW